MYQDGEYRILIARLVAWLNIQIQVGVDERHGHSEPQGAMWSFVYVNVKEGKVAIRNSIHDE
jgi:hypothetical protein